MRTTRCRAANDRRSAFCQPRRNAENVPYFGSVWQQLVLTGLLCLAVVSPAVAKPPAWAERTTAPFGQRMSESLPAVHWRFDDAQPAGTTADAIKLRLRTVGGAKLGTQGPRPGEYPLFSPGNQALGLQAGRAYVKVSDPGENSVLDFTNGDNITLEAWVDARSLSDGTHAYIVGKGRTNNKGFARDNQNYALRLTAMGGTGRLSFLFRSQGTKKKPAEFHRWTSTRGLVFGDGWHHVAVCYTFGQPDSLRGYLDGKPLDGVWDMGGKTTAAPVVDNDELWIGASMGGGGALNGNIDEVAIHRTLLSPAVIAGRFAREQVVHQLVESNPPAGRVLVQLFEGIPDQKAWPLDLHNVTTEYLTDHLAFVQTPFKYNDRGVRIARTSPFLLRATADITFPAGQHTLLLRARNAARVRIDGKLLGQTAFHKISGSAHGIVRKVAIANGPNLRKLQTGDNEKLLTFTATGKPQRVQLDVIVGGSKKRPELGETSVSLQSASQDFVVLAPTLTQTFRLDDQSWYAFRMASRDHLADLNSNTRQTAGVAERKAWEDRHAVARAFVASQPEIPVPAVNAEHVHNDIDRFINHRLQATQQQPHELVDDWSFLRRVTLDVIGTVPTREQIDGFLADRSPRRRANYIDRLLEHHGWADHWVGYWQDVLAENPSLIKPTLNNTGPFRFWIHESFLDNKPVDRFAAELIRMDGGKYVGGPGGFELATQNDVPMAAKAHVVGQAFLGVNMKCARCHDAPFHDIQQQDLFAIAAMLKRSPQDVPKSSSIPLSPEDLDNLIVQVTLKPGSKVQPAWPFGDDFGAGLTAGLPTVSTVPTAVETTGDSREQLASLVTSPANERFAQVIVNRLWRRYMGQGIVEPVDDWEHGEPSHPELLAYLGRELVVSGYDLKHMARLILNSHTYQRTTVDRADNADFLFAGPLRRRMSAEQVVDSLFAASGKDFYAGELTLDNDGALSPDKFLNLGYPQRAWEFVSLSNERDRPSLALPMAQSFTDVLTVFGWRTSRADPLTQRESEPNVLQPAALANSVLARRFTRISEDSVFLQESLAAKSIKELVNRTVILVLARPATETEQQLFSELLREGFEERQRTASPEERKIQRLTNPGVSWSNHLSEEANRLKIELAEQVEQGDPATPQLQPDWRERYEDVLWSLVNSPEFVFLP